MKPRFSFNDAVSAPFVLLRRRPLYLFVWGLLMMAPVAALYSLILPMIAHLPLGAADREAALDAYMAETMKLQLAMNGLTVIMYGLMLLIWTAVGRAALAPDRGDRLLFLRLGMDEVRVAVVIVGVFIAWYAAFIVMILLGVGIGAALWGSGREAVAIGLIGYGLLVLALSIWGWVRVSLIAPASLILKRFAFAEGWAIARGQVWKLVGLNLVIWIIYMLSFILMYAVVGGLLFAAFVGQGLVWPDRIDALADLEPMIRPMIVPALLALIPVSLGYGWAMTLYAAPNVRAARQLLDGVLATPALAMSQDGPPADTLQTL